MKKLWPLKLIFFTIFSFSLEARTNFMDLSEFTQRNRFHLSSSLMRQSVNLEVIKSSNGYAKSSNFSILSQNISGEYFLNNMFSLTGSYSFAITINIDAEVQGFNGGFIYYPLKNGYSTVVESLGNKLYTYPSLSPYLSMQAITRNYQFSTVNLQFKGLEGSLGLNWYFKKKYYLKISASYQKLSNNNSRKMTVRGFSIGIGKQF